MLLVLDGLGWEALQHPPGRACPSSRPATGGPITTVVPSTTPAALTSITTGLAPAQHGILGFRMLVGERSVLNVLRWQLADGGPAARSRSTCSGTPRVRGPAGAGRHQVEFRTTGFTAAHLRGGRLPRLADHRRCWSSTCAGWSPRARRSCTRTTRASTRSRTSSGCTTAYYPAELAAADLLVGALLDALPADAALLVTADHGQVHVGPDGWIGFATARRR